MLPLLDLPTELLLHIVDDMCPDDLDNFFSCSKLLRALADKALQRHRMMKRTSSTVSCGSLSRLYEISKHPISVLQAILADDSYRYYPRKIDIASCEFQVYELNESDDNIYSQIDGILHALKGRIQRLLDGCPYLVDAANIAERNNNLKVYDGRICIALAVTLFPNIRIMNISYNWRWLYLDKMLERIA